MRSPTERPFLTIVTGRPLLQLPFDAINTGPPAIFTWPRPETVIRHRPGQRPDAVLPGQLQPPNVVAVAATDSNDNLAVLELGDDRRSGGARSRHSQHHAEQYLQYFDGTSMATPHVIGGAGARSAPGLTYAQVIAHLEFVDPIPGRKARRAFFASISPARC